MKRSLCVLVVGVFLGSAVTLALGFWLQGGLQNAVAQGGGAETPKGNGDVNGDGKLDVSDGIYMISYVFRGGPAPVPIECPPPGVGALPATGQGKCYDNAGNEISCDSADFPGQDGAYKAGCSMEGRFVDQGDGTVTDTCTGLMWQKDTADVDGNGSIGDEDRLTWQAALQYCEGLSFAGHDDWRLPNVRELQSIVDYGRFDPAIDPVFGAVSESYWSSSPGATSRGGAWGVYFFGGSHDYDDKSGHNYVRAVRNAE